MTISDRIVSILLSSPLRVYGSAAALVLLLAAGVGWPWAVAIVLGGNVAVAVWWGVRLLITRSPW